MSKKKLKKALDKRVEFDKQSREINQNLNQNTLDLIYERKWYTYQHLPYKDGDSGVYIIKFPNNKRYVGSSNHVIKRLKTHMSHLENGSGLDWYKQAAEENELVSRRQKNINRMVINVCYCYDYRSYESSILSSIPEEERCYWYNSIFR